MRANESKVGCFQNDDRSKLTKAAKAVFENIGRLVSKSDRLLSQLDKQNLLICFQSQVVCYAISIGCFQNSMGLSA